MTGGGEIGAKLRRALGGGVYFRGVFAIVLEGVRTVGSETVSERGYGLTGGKAGWEM